MELNEAVARVKSLRDFVERAVNIGGADEPAAPTAKELLALTTLLLELQRSLYRIERP